MSTTEVSASRTRSTAGLVALVTTHAVTDFYSGAVAALLPYLVAEQHYDYAAVAGITLAATSLSSIAQPIFGILSDRFPLRSMVVIGLLVAAVGVALSGLTAGSYWTTWVLVAASGIGVAAYHPSATMEARETGGGSNRSMSVFSVGGNVGVALAPLAVGVTVGLLGLKATPLLAIPAVLAAVAYLVVRRSAAVVVGADAGDVVEQAPAEPDDWRRFGWLLVVVSFWSVAYVGTTSFIALYSIERFDASTGVGSVSLAVFPAAGAIGTLGGGWLADHAGRLRTIRGGYLFAAAASVAIVLAPGTTLVVVAAGVLGIGLFVPFAPQITLAHSYLPRHLGTASGVTLGLSLSFGGFLVPALGHLADTTSIRAVFTVIAVLTAVGFGCSLLLAERRGPHRIR